MQGEYRSPCSKGYREVVEKQSDHGNESQSQEQICTPWTSIQYTLHGTRHSSTSNGPKMSLKQWYFSYCLGKWARILLSVNNQMTKQSTQKAKSAGHLSLCQMHVTGAQILPRSLCLFSWTNLFVVEQMTAPHLTANSTWPCGTELSPAQCPTAALITFLAFTPCCGAHSFTLTHKN